MTMQLIRHFSRRLASWVHLICLSLLASGDLSADTTDDIQAFFANTEFHWEVDAGIVLNHRRGFIDTNNETNADLDVSLWLSGGAYYGRFFLESAPVLSRPLTFGYTLKQNERQQINLITSSFFDEISARNETNGNRLAGILTRRASMEGGIEINHQLGDTLYNVRWVHDLLSRHNGTIFSAQISRPFFTPTTLIQPSFGIAFIDSNATDFYYGVAPQESTLDRSTYRPGSAWIASASVYLERPLNDSWSVVTRLHYAYASSNITNSPLVNHDASYNVHLGMLWVF